MKDKSDGLKKRVGILDRELRVLDDGLSTQVAAQIRQVRRRKDVAEFRKKQVEALRVRAAMDGVLSDMPLELGQWVVPGTVLAKVVKPERLKAVLRVSEVQAKDVAVGQTARIDTHSGVVSGHVARIAPAASQGTVIVDVLLDAELPPVARPDLNVDGIVEIDRLDDVVCVDRPVGAQEDRPLSVFRLTDDGKEAVRVTVAVGKLSLKTIEVKEGLREGARIIVSDMSRWDSASQLALH
jgi:hypothetical protein